MKRQEVGEKAIDDTQGGKKAEPVPGPCRCLFNLHQAPGRLLLRSLPARRKWSSQLSLASRKRAVPLSHSPGCNPPRYLSFLVVTWANRFYPRPPIRAMMAEAKNKHLSRPTELPWPRTNSNLFGGDWRGAKIAHWQFYFSLTSWRHQGHASLGTLIYFCGVMPAVLRVTMLGRLWSTLVVYEWWCQFT
ncbi:hypothetical protein DL89DRAFT_46099 [Linderina pennispora]|uniref:Uncharacterized protein n=1 Tax=Linderina pennispora TaxID=61395 RepID=A0A1Y1W311_9FUNG|nr:uncharacterized protein DL89DRAFT_46099 [Linderina pennispora]ORX67534.1 hypothetical protein DL89DRAFT_46099 [Linderina pennispora]